MTQAPTTSPIGPQAQPAGFAAPRVPPLSVAEPPSALPEPAAQPSDFAAPQQPTVPLSEITPAPPEFRDPTQPYTSAAPQLGPATWDPRQPLATSQVPGSGSATGASTPPTEVDPATLPPPTGPAITAAPSGSYPPGVPSPYPANPYATGPYSAHQGGYPPPGSPAMQPWQASRPAQPRTLMGVVQTANPVVVLLLMTALLWPQISAIALAAGAILGISTKVPGWGALAASLALVILITIPWYFGYIGTGQWHASCQLLSGISVLMVLLWSYNSLHRR